MENGRHPYRDSVQSSQPPSLWLVGNPTYLLSISRPMLWYINTRAVFSKSMQHQQGGRLVKWLVLNWPDYKYDCDRGRDRRRWPLWCSHLQGPVDSAVSCPSQERRDFITGLWSRHQLLLSVTVWKPDVFTLQIMYIYIKTQVFRYNMSHVQEYVVRQLNWHYMCR